MNPSLDLTDAEIGELDEEQRALGRVRQLMREIDLVPETKPVNDLLREMQEATHAHAD